MAEIARVAPEFGSLFELEGVAQITDRVPAQLFVLDTLRRLVITLGHADRVAPSAPAHPFLPVFFQPFQKNMIQERRLRIGGIFRSPHRDGLDVLGAHDRPHSEPRGVVIEVMVDGGISNQAFAGRTDRSNLEILIIQILLQLLPEGLLVRRDW